MTLMVWSAAETLARGLTTGKQVVSCPAAPPVARLGERRAAPPGTRLSEGPAFSRNRRGMTRFDKGASHGTTRDWY